MNTLPETARAYLHFVSVGAKRTSTGRSAPSRNGTNPYAGLTLAGGKYRRCGCFLQSIHLCMFNATALFWRPASEMKAQKMWLTGVEPARLPTGT